MSSYGPTETTVVVTYLPITGAGSNRVGRPMLPGSVFTAFGEVVVVGDLVSAGYLGIEGGGFGIVAAADGTLRRAFATADRVSLDAAGFPVFSGRKDAIVKIGGKRVDTAEVLARVCADPAVSDLAVEPRDGRLGVWFQTGQTRSTGTDSAAAARIRLLLHDLGVPSFFVVAVADLPRRPNGKVDSENLPDLPQNDCAATDTASGTAAALAGMWSRQLDQPIRADTSLLAAGVGSVDLIRILPQTRAYLGRPLTLLDLISADTAANLIEDQAAQGWLDAGTAAQIECDLALLRRPQTAGLAQHRDAGSIVVLGASGILGTGFARAVLDLTRSGASLPDVVFAARSALPIASRGIRCAAPTGSGCNRWTGSTPTNSTRCCAARAPSSTASATPMCWCPTVNSVRPTSNSLLPSPQPAHGRVPDWCICRRWSSTPTSPSRASPIPGTHRIRTRLPSRSPNSW